MSHLATQSPRHCYNKQQHCCTTHKQPMASLHCLLQKQTSTCSTNDSSRDSVGSSRAAAAAAAAAATGQAAAAAANTVGVQHFEAHCIPQELAPIEHSASHHVQCCLGS
jgi:hypothetical protein